VQVLGGLEFDALLLRPSHVVRPKKAFHSDWKLYAVAGIGREQLLANSNVQHTAKDPQFLMDCCRLEPTLLNHTAHGFHLNATLKTAPEIVFDVISRDLTDRSMAECLLEMAACTSVYFVSFLGTNWGLRIVFQEKIHPFREL
jgi:hypothetical protein